MNPYKTVKEEWENYLAQGGTPMSLEAYANLQDYFQQTPGAREAGYGGESKIKDVSAAIDTAFEPVSDVAGDVYGAFGKAFDKEELFRSVGESIPRSAVEFMTPGGWVKGAGTVANVAKNAAAVAGAASGFTKGYSDTDSLLGGVLQGVMPTALNTGADLAVAQVAKRVAAKHGAELAAGTAKVGDAITVGGKVADVATEELIRQGVYFAGGEAIGAAQAAASPTMEYGGGELDYWIAQVVGQTAFLPGDALRLGKEMVTKDIAGTITREKALEEAKWKGADEAARATASKVVAPLRTEATPVPPAAAVTPAVVATNGGQASQAGASTNTKGPGQRDAQENVAVESAGARTPTGGAEAGEQVVEKPRKLSELERLAEKTFAKVGETTVTIRGETQKQESFTIGNSHLHAVKSPGGGFDFFDAKTGTLVFNTPSMDPGKIKTAWVISQGGAKAVNLTPEAKKREIEIAKKVEQTKRDKAMLDAISAELAEPPAGQKAAEVLKTAQVESSKVPETNAPIKAPEVVIVKPTAEVKPGDAPRTDAVAPIGKLVDPVTAQPPVIVSVDSPFDKTLAYQRVQESTAWPKEQALPDDANKNFEVSPFRFPWQREQSATKNQIDANQYRIGVYRTIFQREGLFDAWELDADKELGQGGKRLARILGVKGNKIGDLAEVLRGTELVVAPTNRVNKEKRPELGDMFQRAGKQTKQANLVNLRRWVGEGNLYYRYNDEQVKMLADVLSFEAKVAAAKTVEEREKANKKLPMAARGLLKQANDYRYSSAGQSLGQETMLQAALRILGGDADKGAIDDYTRAVMMTPGLTAEQLPAVLRLPRADIVKVAGGDATIKLDSGVAVSVVSTRAGELPEGYARLDAYKKLVPQMEPLPGLSAQETKEYANRELNSLVTLVADATDVDHMHLQPEILNKVLSRFPNDMAGLVRFLEIEKVHKQAFIDKITKKLIKKSKSETVKGTSRSLDETGRKTQKEDGAKDENDESADADLAESPMSVISGADVVTREQHLRFLENLYDSGSFEVRTLNELVDRSTTNPELRTFRRVGMPYAISALNGEANGYKQLQILHHVAFPGRKVPETGEQMLRAFFGESGRAFGKSEFSRKLMGLTTMQKPVRPTLDLATPQSSPVKGLLSASITSYFVDRGYTVQDADVLGQVAMNFATLVGEYRGTPLKFAVEELEGVDETKQVNVANYGKYNEKTKEVWLGTRHPYLLEREGKDQVAPFEVLIHEMLHALDKPGGVKNSVVFQRFNELKQSLLAAGPGVMEIVAQLTSGSAGRIKRDLSAGLKDEAAVYLVGKMITAQLQADYYGAPTDLQNRLKQASPELNSLIEKAAPFFGFQSLEVLKSYEAAQKDKDSRFVKEEVYAKTKNFFNVIADSYEKVLTDKLRLGMLLRTLENPAVEGPSAVEMGRISHDLMQDSENVEEFFNITKEDLKERSAEVGAALSSVGSYVLGGMTPDKQVRLSWFTRLFAPTHLKYRIYEQRGVATAKDANILLANLSSKAKQEVWKVFSPLLKENDKGFLEINEESDFVKFVNPKNGTEKIRNRKFLNEVRLLTNTEEGSFRYDDPKVHEEFNSMLFKLSSDATVRQQAIITLEKLYKVNSNLAEFQISTLGQETTLLLARWLQAARRYNIREAKDFAQQIAKNSAGPLQDFVQASALADRMENDQKTPLEQVAQQRELAANALADAMLPVLQEAGIDEQFAGPFVKFLADRAKLVDATARNYASQPGYLSEERIGRWIVQAGKGKERVVLSAKTEAEAFTVKQSLRGRFTEDQILIYDKYKRFGRHAGVTRQDTALELLRMETVALENWFNSIKESEMSGEQKKELLNVLTIGEQLVSDITAQGFKRAQQERNFVGGREEIDTVDTFTEHVGATVRRGTSRLQRLEAELIKNDPFTLASTEFSVDFEKTFKAVTAPEGPAAQHLKTAIAAFFMGGNLSSAMVEGLQSVQTLIPHMLREEDSPKKVMTAYKYAIKLAMRLSGPNAIKKLRGSASPKDREFAALLGARLEDGTLSMTHLAESTGVQDQNAVVNAKLGNAEFQDTNIVVRTGNGLQSAATWLLKLHTTISDKNLQIGYIAFLEMGWNKGLRGEALADYALLNMRVGLGGGGKANRPGLINLVEDSNVRGAIAVTQALQSYGYMVVAHWLNDAKASFKGDKRAMRAFAYQTSVGVALSGAMGLPFAGATLVLMEQMFGIKAGEAVREGLAALAGEDEELGSIISNSVMNGLANQVTGIDIGSRVGTDAVLGFNKYSGYDMRELAGPGVSLFTKLLEGLSATAKGDVSGALRAASPPALRGLVEQQSAWTDQAGNLILNPSGYERATFALGFRPTRLVEAKQHARLLDVSRRIDSQRRREHVGILADHLLEGNSTAVLQAISAKASEDSTFDPRAYLRSVVDQAIDTKIPRDLLSKSRGGENLSGTFNSAPFRRSEVMLLNMKDQFYRALGYPYGLQPPSRTALARARAIDKVIERTGVSRSEAIAHVDQASKELGL